MGVKKEQYYNNIEINKPKGEKIVLDKNNITDYNMRNSAQSSVMENDSRLMNIGFEARIFIASAALLSLAVSVLTLGHLSILILGAYIFIFSALIHKRTNSHKTEKLLVCEECMAGGVAVMVIPFIWHYNYIMVHSYIGFISFIASLLMLTSPFVNWLIRRSRCTGTAEGRCTGLEEKNDSLFGKLYAPVWRYTVEGREYVCTEKTYKNRPEYAEGDTKEIHFNPNMPEDTAFFGKGSLLFTVLVGLAFGVFGVVSMMF